MRSRADLRRGRRRFRGETIVTSRRRGSSSGRSIRSTQVGAATRFPRRVTERPRLTGPSTHHRLGAARLSASPSRRYSSYDGTLRTWAARRREPKNRAASCISRRPGRSWISDGGDALILSRAGSPFGGPSRPGPRPRLTFGTALSQLGVTSIGSVPAGAFPDHPGSRAASDERIEL